MQYLWVGTGGILGSLARYILGKWITEKTKGYYPIGTFIINITGAFLLGLLSLTPGNGNLYHLLGDGFLGAYTTFSTLMYEGFNLFQDNERLNALVYITGSTIIGILGFTAGRFLIGLLA